MSTLAACRLRVYRLPNCSTYGDGTPTVKIPEKVDARPEPEA